MNVYMEVQTPRHPLQRPGAVPRLASEAIFLSKKWDENWMITPMT